MKKAKSLIVSCNKVTKIGNMNGFSDVALLLLRNRYGYNSPKYLEAAKRLRQQLKKEKQDDEQDK